MKNFDSQMTMSIITYVITNAFLFVVNWITNPHYWWVLWVVAGWGLQLILSLTRQYLKNRDEGKNQTTGNSGANLLLLATLLFSLGASAPAAATAPQELKVIVTDIRNSNGNVLIALQSPTGEMFDYGMKEAIQATDHTLTFTFNVAAEKEFSVMVFHDENSNYQLERTPQGAPAEGVGMWESDKKERTVYVALKYPEQPKQ